jgi:hypothetical protein
MSIVDVEHRSFDDDLSWLESDDVRFNLDATDFDF